MGPVPNPIRILFFKAIQHALFDAPIVVPGHTRPSTGTFVAPYASRRKKRLDPPRTSELFGATAQHPARTQAAATARPEMTLPPTTPARPPVQRIKERMEELFAEPKGTLKPEPKPIQPQAQPAQASTGGGAGGDGGDGNDGSGNGGNGGEPPQEHGPFGPIFRQFYHDAQGAIAHLRQQQTGEAVAALYHPEVGDIDLVWGKEEDSDKNYKGGYGLAKIAAKHPNVIQDLQGFLLTLKKNPQQSGKNRIRLESTDRRAQSVIRLEWEENQKTWLLTAYEKIKAGEDTRTDTTPLAGKDDTASLAADLKPSIDPPVLSHKSPAPPADDLDPASPNYRYRDTGYIAGSRKEEAANQIRRAGREGRRLLTTDIDWDVIEQNPREAKALITKSNLFGAVDWVALRAGGMDPGAGFLLDRVYASIGKEPSEDRPQARQDYALGLQTVRDRLERCKTPDEVTQVLSAMREELEGTMLTAEQTAQLQPLIEQRQAAFKTARAAEQEVKQRWDNFYRLGITLNGKRYEQAKRQRRRWKPDPELEQQIADLEIAKSAAEQEWENYRNAHPEAVEVTHKRDLGNGRTEYSQSSPLMDTYHGLREREQQVRAQWKAQNTLANPLFRAWLTLGERFVNVLRYRSYRGSDAFGEHVARVKAGKITDWSWAEKDGPLTAPTITKNEVNFTLKVAENYQRHGGRAVAIDSTAAFKTTFHLRDVQSGNWVLNDPNSARWHIQHAAEALADLADMLEVPDDQISLNSRLALAFGARGKGNLGFHGATRAHYEPVQRVINITKMGGGGCLAHEWFHSLDNLLLEAETGQPSGIDTYATEAPTGLPGELGAAMTELMTAISAGSFRQGKTHAYTSLDVKTAAANLRPRPGDYGTPAPVKLILAASDVHAAVQALEAHYATRNDRKAQQLLKDWTRIAVAHYGGDPNGGTLKVQSGPTRSSFAHEAVNLDAGNAGKYWSKPRELAARAFQAYCEDKLAAQNRRSDYLSAMADNKYYVDPLFGPRYPFPAGEERKQINAAFDRLIATLKHNKSLEKALRMAKKQSAHILFFKAGPLKNRPGLALQTVTTVHGASQRWKRTAQKPLAHPQTRQADPDPHDQRGSAHGYGTHDLQPGSTIQFKVGDYAGKGVVSAVGSAGVTAKDAEGRPHRVHFHEITHHQPGEKARPTPGHSIVLGPQKPIPAASFVAADYAKSHDQADVTPEKILAGFPPDTTDRIKAAQDRLKTIEQTIDRFKQDGKWNAQRELLHHKIIAGILSPERVKAATPPPGQKPTFILLGGRGGCLSGDHEYLTRSGWKRIDQYEAGEEILVFDPNMNTTKFELPQDYINLPCEEFLHFKSRGVDMMLSEEHKILFNKKYNTNVWRTESALEVAAQHDQLAGGWDGMIPCTFPAPDNARGIDLTDDELRLMVAVCADGNFALQTTKHCRMALRKDRKKARIRELLNLCGIEFTETTYDNRPTESRFSFYAPSNNKTLSAYWDASPAQLSIIADEIVQWDGWQDKHGAWIYTSTNYNDIDFASYLFSSQGRRSSFYCDDREDTGWKPIWRISGATNGGFAGLRYSSNKSPIEIIPSADGRKYCFTVSTGFFVTRRNDCVAITGNSGKSSLEGRVYDKSTCIVLDADALKKELPEYEGWNAHQVHEESSALFEKITDLAQQFGLNICHDATMKTSKKAVDLVKRFKAAGYRTEAHYMHLPRQEAAKRAVKRFLDGGEKGRYVPVDVVLSNTSNEASFDAVTSLVDRWSFRDNNVPKGSKPILISEGGAALQKSLKTTGKVSRPILIRSL